MQRLVAHQTRLQGLQQHICQHKALNRPSLPNRSASQEMQAAGTLEPDRSTQLPPELADFRPNVGVCVVNQRGLVFAARRCKDKSHKWQMPQGGIDPGETPLQAAIRELAEETSIHSIKLLAEVPHWLHYEFPSEVRQRLHGPWSKYKGQAQRWFLFKFTGDDSEINLDTEHKEFIEWRWMPLRELPSAAIEFKREVYEAVVAEFAPLLNDMKEDQRV